MQTNEDVALEDSIGLSDADVDVSNDDNDDVTDDVNDDDSEEMELMMQNDSLDGDSMTSVRQLLGEETPPPVIDVLITTANASTENVSFNSVVIIHCSDTNVVYSCRVGKHKPNTEMIFLRFAYYLG